tara:strand:- start:2161 stop:2397 length:237 start_codon:yes stop_codon:yes gene_type:complete
MSDVVVDHGESPALVALMLADILIPEKKLHSVFSRTSLWRLRRSGMPVYKVPSVGVCVKPSDLKEHLECVAHLTESSE